MHPDPIEDLEEAQEVVLVGLREGAVDDVVLPDHRLVDGRADLDDRVVVGGRTDHDDGERGVDHHAHAVGPHDHVVEAGLEVVGEGAGQAHDEWQVPPDRLLEEGDASGVLLGRILELITLCRSVLQQTIQPADLCLEACGGLHRISLLVLVSIRPGGVPSTQTVFLNDSKYYTTIVKTCQ